MKKPLVSIIIPVYNGEKFIDKCLDSVLNQTYKNTEIIISNDGSKDKSLDMIKKYAKKYKNIKYDSHDNVGLSITRNIALESATGDYVTYLDVDDYLDYDFLEKMLKDNKDYDVIIGSYKSVFDDGKINFEYDLKDKTFWDRFRRVTVWAKLYKLSFLKENNITFPNIRLFGEDVVYTMRTLSKTTNVKIVTDCNGYNNYVNPESITHKENFKILTDVEKMINEIDDYISKDKDYLKNNADTVKYYLYKILVAYLIDLANFINKDELIKYYDKHRKMINKIFKKYKFNSRIKWMKGEKFKIQNL